MNMAQYVALLDDVTYKLLDGIKLCLEYIRNICCGYRPSATFIGGQVPGRVGPRHIRAATTRGGTPLSSTRRRCVPGVEPPGKASPIANLSRIRSTRRRAGTARDITIVRLATEPEQPRQTEQAKPSPIRVVVAPLGCRRGGAAGRTCRLLCRHRKRTSRSKGNRQQSAGDSFNDGSHGVLKTVVRVTSGQRPFPAVRVVLSSSSGHQSHGHSPIWGSLDVHDVTSEAARQRVQSIHKPT